MVGEGAVELEVHRHVLEGEALEDGRDHLAGHAVASVDDYLERPQILRVDEAEAVFGVVFCYVGLFDGARVLRCGRKVSPDDEVEDFAQASVAGEGDGVFAAELEAVVVFGVVRGGDHGAAGFSEVPHGEVQGVGRDELEVEHVGPSLRYAFNERLLQRLAREAHIAGHDDPGALEIQVFHEGAPDVTGYSLVQVLRINAADVVGLEYGLVEHLLPPDFPTSVFGIRYNSGLSTVLLIGMTKRVPS